MYKQASRLRLRFQTTIGELSAEQLWDLSLSELDGLAVSLEQEYKNSKGKSFLAKKTSKDKSIKLKFDLVLDILTTKAEEAEVLANAAEVKQHNQKILGLIKDKQDAELGELSIEELESQLK